jgi:catechol O-methyltransferase
MMQSGVLKFAAIAVVVAIVIAIQFPGYVSLVKFAISGALGFSDGREILCLEFVRTNATQGNASDVMRAIDTFGWNHQFLMNVGDDKGKILTEALLSKSPRNALEIGAYVGYSAVRTASALPADSHLTSVEFSSFNAGIARQMVEYAGLSHKVTIVEGTISTVLKDHMKTKGLKNFDFVFVDHEKSAYLPDLLYLVNEKLLQPGAVVVGDNILFPGAPDYRKFVNSSPLFQTVEHHSNVEYLSIPDVVTVSTYVG